MGREARDTYEDPKSNRCVLCSVDVPLEWSISDDNIICNEQGHGDGGTDSDDSSKNFGGSLEMSGSWNSFSWNASLCFKFVIVGIDVSRMVLTIDVSKEPGRFSHFGGGAGA